MPLIVLLGEAGPEVEAPATEETPEAPAAEGEAPAAE